MLKNPIGTQSLAVFEEKTERMKESYRDTATEDKPFFTEYGETTVRNELCIFMVMGF